MALFHASGIHRPQIKAWWPCGMAADQGTQVEPIWGNWSWSLQDPGWTCSEHLWGRVGFTWDLESHAISMTWQQFYDLKLARHISWHGWHSMLTGHHVAYHGMAFHVNMTSRGISWHGIPCEHDITWHIMAWHSMWTWNHVAYHGMAFHVNMTSRGISWHGIPCEHDITWHIMAWHSMWTWHHVAYHGMAFHVNMKSRGISWHGIPYEHDITWHIMAWHSMWTWHHVAYHGMAFHVNMTSLQTWHAYCEPNINTDMVPFSNVLVAGDSSCWAWRGVAGQVLVDHDMQGWLAWMACKGSRLIIVSWTWHEDTHVHGLASHDTMAWQWWHIILIWGRHAEIQVGPGRREKWAWQTDGCQEACLDSGHHRTECHWLPPKVQAWEEGIWEQDWGSFRCLLSVCHLQRALWCHAVSWGRGHLFHQVASEIDPCFGSQANGRTGLWKALWLSLAIKLVVNKSRY